MRLRQLVKAYPAGVLAVILALAATVFALGATEQRPAIADGASWLWSGQIGEAAQVNAVSANVSLRQPMIDAQGHQVRIAQSDRYVILHDLVTGRVTSIDLTRLGFSGSLDLGVAEDTAVLLDGATAILVDRSRGLVRPVDPATLQATGDQLRLPAPLVGGAFDKSGRLWMSVPSQGTAIGITVHEGQLVVDRTEAVSPPGNSQALTVLDDGALVVDRGGDTITVVDAQGTRKIKSPMPLTSAVLPQRTVGKTAAITLPGERKILAIGDTATGAPLATLPLPAPTSEGAAVQPAVSFAGRVYVPDDAAGTVQVFTTDGNSAGTIEVSGAQTPVELEVREEYLFINAPDTQTAVMVDGDGKASTVDKYDPEQQTTPTPTPQPSQAPSPDPKPSAAPSPAKPSSRPSTVQAQPQRPGPPVPVTALAGDAQVRVSWGRSRQGSAPVQRYTVSWEEAGGGQVQVGGGVLQTTITGLANGTTYRFRVFATNSIGAGPPALSGPVTPQAVPPPATPATPAATRELNTAGVPTGAVEVSWTAVPQAIEYVVTPLLDGAAGANPPQTVTGTGARFAGLTPGRSYSFTVAARNSAGAASAASAPSNALVVHYPPGAPGAVTGRQTAANTYVITWTAADWHGLGVHHYIVRDTNGGHLAQVDGDRLTATVTATALTRVRVIAHNGDGDGPAGEGAVTAAGAPRVNITATSATSNSVTVTFGVNAGGAAATCTVTVGASSVTSCASPVTISGLAAATQYTVTVQASSFAGTGSDTANRRTGVVTVGARVTCTDSPSNPQPAFCAAGLPVYSASNDNGTVSRRVANGSRLQVVCAVHGENQNARPYNNKEGDHWLRLSDGGWMSWVWLRFDNGDNVEAIADC